MVDGAHEKETRARETIQSLKLEIANLSKLVEQGAGLTMGQDHRCVFMTQKEDLGIKPFAILVDTLYSNSKTYLYLYSYTYI